MPKVKLLTWNVRGLQGTKGLKKLLVAFQERKRKQKYGAVLLQEHKLEKAKHEDYVKLAKAKGFTLHASYGTIDDTESRAGGSLIITDDSTLTSELEHVQPGFVKAKVTWGEETFRLASAYAPTNTAQRIRYLNNIEQHITSDMVVGGDWNCVRDLTRDVKSADPANYDNGGSDTLERIMSVNALVDERGEGLEEVGEVEYTWTNGRTSTRIDRWYVPLNTDNQWTIFLDNTWNFKKTKPDHTPIVLEVETVTGDMGGDRETINVRLLDDTKVLDTLTEMITTEWGAGGTALKRWKSLHGKMKDYLMGQTKLLKKRTKVDIRRTEKFLKWVGEKHAGGKATPQSVAYEKRLNKELYELRNPEVLNPPTDREGFQMYERAEVCSRAMFSTYKDKAKQNWVGKLRKAQWEEGKEPTWGEHTTTLQGVGAEFVKLYKVIFAQKTIEKEEKLLQRLSKNKLLKSARDMLDAPMGKKEAAATMEHLPEGKQPGPNRLPNEVYKRLSSVLAGPFSEMINESRTSKRLPSHFLEGDISMLYKHKGQRDDPRNYRPITLLNSDYKIFTRVLAKRMNKVVHQFVSETQKGFVPDAFIAESAMLMKTIEAHINEEPEDRQGIFLFLDMEKAFDRVSYEFTKKGLEALGFGKHFRRWVGMMYDENRPPQRRMYVNGYYSEWFPIKSGVAQGCPLSPLLFLIVAEALKCSLEMEKDYKGIEVRDRVYKMSQFADDTILFLAGLRDLKLGQRAIRRWCKATGMRENVKKREGLAMGKLRGRDLEGGIKWVKEGEWCISLGVPMGNEMSDEKWWSEKIRQVRAKAAAWTTLERTKYFGRNLIVQGMYYGRYRYWLYSLCLSKKMAEVIQKDADVMLWARDPTMQAAEDGTGMAQKDTRRIRRWVAKDTAIAPVAEGGVNMMDWVAHSKSFVAEWVVRYLDPSEVEWKKLWDSFILYDSRGRLLYPEGRAILIHKLSTREKNGILKRFPKKAYYARACLTEFWKLKIKPEKENYAGVGSESPWHSHRLPIETTRSQRRYYSETLDVTQWSDFMDGDTGELFTENQWRWMVKELEKKATGVEPHNDTIISRAQEMCAIQNLIPDEMEWELKKEFETTPKKDAEVYLCRAGKAIPAIIINEREAQLVRIDSVGRGHRLQRKLEFRRWSILKARMWKGRWAGVTGNAYAHDTVWKFGKVNDFNGLDIQALTKGQIQAKIKKSAAPEKWKDRIGPVMIRKAWRKKISYVTPRDKITLMKIQRRNLWVAKNGGMEDTKCRAPGCGAEESQAHLMQCPVIKDKFWEKIREGIVRLGGEAENKETFWLTGEVGGKLTGADTMAIIAWAWRALYAATVQAHVEQKNPKYEEAVFNTWRFAIGRVKAHGYRWRRWYVRQRQWMKPKRFPIRHRENMLISLSGEAVYTIHKELFVLFEEARTRMTRGRR